MTEKMPILIVDDDSQMARSVSDILRFRGYDTVSAGSGREGLTAARAGTSLPAIALIDLKLPDMDGMELVAQLRAIAPGMEVVIVTGNASLESALRALREQSFDYLLKPVNPGDLMASVGRAGDRWQRRQAEAALEDSELRLRRMFECVSDAVFITDDERYIIEANPAAAAFSGCAIEQLYGASLDAILAASSRPVDVRSDVFAPGRHVHSVRDLSEQRRLEAALHQTQKMEAVGRLASGVAHDFNNLLTVIMSFTSMIMSRNETNHPDRASLEHIKGAAERGAALTRQLLTFTRGQTLAPRSLDLNETVRGIEGILRRLVGDQLDVATALDPSIGTIFADSGQIEQVLINLASNARDAMPTGGLITISTRNADGPEVPVPGAPLQPGVLLTVTDTGDGMTAETMEHIFEPFFTTKKERGTGLGLATVHGIVQQAGGAIRVDSELGRGTTFRIFLPRTVAG